MGWTAGKPRPRGKALAAVVLASLVFAVIVGWIIWAAATGNFDWAVSSRAARTAARLFASTPGVEFLVINVSRLPAPWVGAAGFGAFAPLDVDPRWLRDDDDQADNEILMVRADAAGLWDAEPISRVRVIPSSRFARRQKVGASMSSSSAPTIGSALGRLLNPSVAAGVVRDTYLPVLVRQR